MGLWSLNHGAEHSMARYTILLFLGSEEFSWELSRNVLQGAPN